MELQMAIGYWIVFFPTVFFLFFAGYLIYRLAPCSLAALSAVTIIQLYIPSLTIQFNFPAPFSRYYLAVLGLLILFLFSICSDINRFKTRLAQTNEEIEHIVDELKKNW